MELLLPWSNLNVYPVSGLELALQVYVMECEGEKDCVTAMWHPAGESHMDSYAVHRIRLTEKGSHTVTISATAQDDLQRNGRTVRILGPADLAGKTYEAKTDNGSMFGSLTLRGTQAYGALDLPREQACEILLGKQRVPVVQLPPEDNLQTVMSQKLECRFPQCVFSGEKFPQPYLEGARNYKITQTQFYDAQFNPVASAAQPGRYGAVVQVRDNKGKLTTRRFRTLFRVPEQLATWRLNAGKVDDLPRQLSDNPKVLELASQTLVARPT